jgi:hypothetical protein
MRNTMLLVTSSWGSKKTFKMIPASTDSIYNEVIFDPDSKMLAIIGKEKKESMHMIAKLDEFGDVKPMKIGKRSNGKDYAEERKTLETFYEYYIESANEVKDFVKSVAVNADSFDFNQYIDAPVEKPTTPMIQTV